MSEWTTKSLGSMCTKIGSGATPTGGKESYRTEGISLIRSQNVEDFVFLYNGLAHIDDEQARRLNNVSIVANDTLVNITGDSVARVCSVPDNILPARVNQHVAIVRADGVQLDNTFAKYMLLAMKEQLLSIAEIGATRRALTKEMLENLEVSCPNLDTQKAIAEVLTSLDDKVGLLTRQNATLESLTQTYFQEWFVENNTEMGRLDSIADITMGQSPKGESYNEDGNGTVFFQGRGEFGWRYPTIRLYTTAPQQMAHKGDILMSVRAPVGDINVAETDCCIGRGLAAIRSQYHTFTLYAIKSQGDQLDIFNGEGTIFGSISKEGLNGLQIPLPSEALIKQFENRFFIIDKKIERNSAQILTLQKLRDTLLPKLISGEVRVRQ
ncbi:MAG: restriction endonuclease subunit S [Desulfovibrio sp.]|jgi:type I restriction enzyme S subunit|nr:restriction endonuclease subunit S [Desulfovibrio sp.]